MKPETIQGLIDSIQTVLTSQKTTLALSDRRKLEHTKTELEKDLLNVKQRGLDPQTISNIIQWMALLVELMKGSS
jgi:hypothetical protein